MKGLSVRTTSLGFRVLRLHYSCDIDKDPATEQGKRWYEEARRGMPDARFRQEYELDYGALSGQLVFPTFEETIHIVPAQFPIDPRFSTVWMACDPHPRTAHAFLWLAVNKEGEMAVVWSWWPEERHQRETLIVRDYVKSLNEIDDYQVSGNVSLGLKPYYELMDVAGKSFNATEELSYFDVYRNEGRYFRPAKKNRDLSARHLIDCLSYILLDDPEFVSQEKRVSTWKLQYPAIGY